jgi:hypothetical protein
VSVTKGGSGAGQGQGTGQGTLFDGDSDLGYRGPTACHAAGITYRQLDYWARTRLVEPSVRAAHGSGSQRLYSFRDILVLKVVKRQRRSRPSHAHERRGERVRVHLA